MSNADRVALRFVEEAAFNDFPSENLTGLTVSTTQASKRYTDAGAGLADFKVGQLVFIAGFTNADSNGWKTVAVVDSSGNYIEVVEAIGADEAAVSPVSIQTALEELRFTSEGLSQETDSVESNEIRDDRQVSEVPRTNINAAGDLAFEFSYDAYDQFLRAALEASDWSDEEVVGPVGTIDAANADNSFNDSGSGFGNIVANQWIKVSGFANAANNGYFKVVSATAAKIIVEGGTLVTEGAGPSVTITMGAQITNGITPRSYLIEREYTDLSSPDNLARYTGMMIDTFGLDISAEAIITGTFGFLGKQESSQNQSVGAGVNRPSAANQIMNAIDHVVSILENLSEIEATTLTLALTNNLRTRNVIGVLGADSVGEGKVGVTGTLQMYFETKAIMDKYLNYESTPLAFILQDDAGNAYVVDLPRTQFTSGTRVAGGKNTDVIADMAFTSYEDAEEGITIRIAKFAA